MDYSLILQKLFYALTSLSLLLSQTPASPPVLGSATSPILGGTEDEYWVYLNPQDELEDIVGRAQKGDIIDIVSTKRGNGLYSESKDFLIIKVKGLTETEIQTLLQPYTDGETILMDRKYSFDLKDFSKSVGTIPIAINAKTIRPIEKTASTLQAYKTKAGISAVIKPLRNFVRSIIPLAFATTQNTFYIDPDAAAGGDGTTNGLSGATAAFQSCAIWENARDNVGGLVALDTIEEAIADSNGASHTADATACVIGGWTTGVNNYITIHTPTTSRHTGVYNTSKYRLEISNTYGVYLIEDYIKINGLQIKAATNGIQMNLMTASNNKFEISQNLIVGMATTTATYGFLSYDVDTNAYFWNNIIYGFSLYGFAGENGTKFYVYNNTFASSTRGILANATTKNVTAINNIVKGAGNTNAYVGSFGTSTDYNSTDGTDNTEGGANSLRSQTFTFVSEVGGSQDFHLQTSDTGAKNHGLDLNPDPDGFLTITDDIEQDVRPDGASTWDIGADEFVSGEPPVASPPQNTKIIWIEE